MTRATRLVLSSVLITATTLVVPFPAGAALSECAGRPATIKGTEGRDVIRGTARPDIITAGGGDDVVRGLGGNDLMCGGTGRDRLVGGAGHDTLHGLSNADVLHGGRGRDSLFGYGGYRAGERPDSAEDDLNGGRGDDAINFFSCPEEPFLCPVPDGGEDPTHGGAGDDTIGVCNDGQSVVSGGPGRDEAAFCSSVTADLSTQRAEFNDGSGAAVILVGFEDLSGAPWESDTLIGDEGANRLFPGYDGQTDHGVQDDMSGVDGNDTFYFGGGDGIDGGAGDDRFFPAISTDRKTALVLHGGGGDDRFLMCFGRSGNPEDGWHYQLFGESGLDSIEFGFGATFNLTAGEGTCGDDTATVSEIEILVGSRHEGDVFVGDASDNVLRGRGGDDDLDGADGDDVLRGGDGTDSCRNGEDVQGCE